MRPTFVGKELLSLECTALIDPESARRLLDLQMPLQEHEGRAVLGLLFFQMSGLSLYEVGWPSFSYQEVLWRLGVVHNGAPAWFGVRCGIDRRLVREAARVLFRYPVYPERFTVEEGPTSTRIGWSDQEIVASAPQRSSQEAPRRLFVAQHQTLYEVFWAERPATRCEQVEVSVCASLPKIKEIAWNPLGRLYRGRTHICGIARAVSHDR